MVTPRHGKLSCTFAVLTSPHSWSTSWLCVKKTFTFTLTYGSLETVKEQENGKKNHVRLALWKKTRKLGKCLPFPVLSPGPTAHAIIDLKNVEITSSNYFCGWLLKVLRTQKPSVSITLTGPYARGGSGGSEEPSRAATRSAQPNEKFFFLISVYFLWADHAPIGRFCKTNFGTIFGKVLVRFRQVRFLRYWRP